MRENRRVAASYFCKKCKYGKDRRYFYIKGDRGNSGRCSINDKNIDVQKHCFYGDNDTVPTYFEQCDYDLMLNEDYYK